MGKGRARCLAVPAPGRRPAARLTGQPEAGPGAVIGAGAVGCPGRPRQRHRCAGRGTYAAGRTGPVELIREAGEVHLSGGRRPPPLCLASFGSAGGTLSKGAEYAAADVPFQHQRGLGRCLVRVDAAAVRWTQRGSQVRKAVAAALRAYGGRGCAERVAQEYGDHPETAVARMRWARGVVGEVFGAPGSEQDGRRRRPGLRVPGPRGRRLVRI
jgi:hypothetical protein